MAKNDGFNSRQSQYWIIFPLASPSVFLNETQLVSE